MGKNMQKIEKSKPIRIPKNQLQKIIKIGEGDFRQGLTKIITIYENSISHPEGILMRDVELLMSDLNRHYGENHYAHFGNFPAFFRMFLKKGYTNPDILKIRPEKAIDEYSEQKEEKAKEVEK